MPGLHFYKLDLHVHTPASKCYLHKDNTADQIVQAALEKGLDGLAITDHNTAQSISGIQAAAQGKSLTIFPGVEVSLEAGYHLVAIFDPSTDQKHIESFLGAIDITPEQYGKSDAYCKKSVHEVIAKIHERNGLAILAHIDQPKGAFQELSQDLAEGKIRVPVTCSGLFNEAQYDAVECASGALPNGYDAQHQLKRFPAIYQASDNPDAAQPTKHSKDGIGSRHSLFKLDQINIEGLRQCFADPEVRIQLMGYRDQADYSRIISMKVGEAGFLRNQSFDFHEGLNCLIGGKGVGKSLAIELLRFCLNQAPTDEDLLMDHVGKLEKRLEPGNWVEVIYQTAEGTRYLTKRSFNGRKSTRTAQYDSNLVCKNLETGAVFEGDIQRIFRLLAYSQTEVIKIAENRDAQLQLIDGFIDTRPHDREFTEIIDKLEDNDSILNSAMLARNRLESCQKEVNTLAEEIASIDVSLANPLFDAMKEAEYKNLQFDGQIEHLNKLISLVREWQNDLREILLDELPEDQAYDTDLADSQSIANKAKPIISQSLAEVIPQLMALKENLEHAKEAWEPEFDRVSMEYNNFLHEIGGNKEAKSRERKRLDTQLTKLRKEEQGYLNASAKLPELLNTRRELLDQLERCYRDLYNLRKTKYDELSELSDQKLQLILNHAADRNKYETNLSELLRGGQNAPPSTDRSKISSSIMPRRFVQLVLDKNATHLASESGLTELWANRIIEKLWSSDDFTKVLALQHNCYPSDVPSIRFRKEGGVYDDLTELSVGQKCTALLIIALCDGTMPVIIDQPEDALDIISVWEDIAKKLRRGKNSRQFILTTHNSSVAVASDTDQFIVMKAGASSGRVVASGAIDRPDVKKAVIDHLEGGEDPYILRSKKYNIHPEQK